ncbi:hypothetical protein TNCV_4568341 [Trichonephila clavipes]|nr:hypothetical protein TNCV_4568341 [Trichonephila clavipes]
MREKEECVKRIVRKKDSDEKGSNDLRGISACLWGDSRSSHGVDTLLDCESYKKYHFSSPAKILPIREGSFSTVEIMSLTISIRIDFWSLFSMMETKC